MPVIRRALPIVPTVPEPDCARRVYDVRSATPRTSTKEPHNTLEWLGLREMTEYAAVSERTLRAWIRLPSDPLPAARVGGKILIRRTLFDGWLERHPIQPLSSVDVDAIVRELVTR